MIEFSFLPNAVTRHLNSEFFRRAEAMFRPTWFFKKGAGSHSGLCRHARGGPFFRPFADAVLREEVSSRTSPDITEGSYDAVRRYAKVWRAKRGAAIAEAYVPPSFAPGEAYQFDWSQDVVLIKE
jgi:hypothetical protein